MRALAIVIGFVFLACAPSLSKTLSSESRARPVSSFKAEAERMEADRRECAAANAKPDEAAFGRLLLDRWLAPATPDGKAREPRSDTRVSTLGASLAPYASASGVTWVFLVDERPELDSFSVPGATVLVTRGLLDAVSSDAQLAGVLAHEMAHVTRRHQLTALAEVQQLACQSRRVAEAMLANEAARGAQTRAPPVVAEALTQGLVESVAASLLGKLRHASSAEGFAADATAARTLHAAGIDVAEFIALIQRLAPTAPPPELSTRVKALEAVRASLPPLKPAAHSKPNPPTKKPKR